METSRDSVGSHNGCRCVLLASGGGENWDAAQHLTVARTSPPQIVVQPEVSVVLRLRIPDLA